MHFLDDIDPRTLTDEQRAKLRELYEQDPYTFYSLWRDPEQVQRWAEGEGFKTEPANDLYAKVGALTMAQAPESVIEFWRETLERRGRNEDTSLLPPATRPVKKRLEEIDKLCEYLNGLLNWDEDNLEPDKPEDDFPDEVPFAGKWLRLMQRASGKVVVNHHEGTVRHYKETNDVVEASMGLEVVEVLLEPDTKLELDLEEWSNEYIKPDAAIISQINGKTKLRLEFFYCYT